jgi:hypothetical protein
MGPAQPRPHLPKRSPDGPPHTSRSVSRAGPDFCRPRSKLPAWFRGTRQAGAPMPDSTVSPSAPSTNAGRGTAAMATAPAQPDRPAGTASCDERCAAALLDLQEVPRSKGWATSFWGASLR